MASRASDVRADVRRSADPVRAKLAQGYFKTGPGEYGEGDRFLGLKAADLRRVAATYRDLPLPEVERLLASPWHEDRAAGLLIMAHAYAKADAKGQTAIYRCYLAHTDRVNNWDLVDMSAPHIVGRHLAHRSRRTLYRLARSGNLWERRIAIISTFHFIRDGEFDETLALAGLLLGEEEDLIHKAVGWALREVGKRDRGVLEAFLDAHAERMPRTMLRYAIERFPQRLRKRYLARRRLR